MTLTLVEARERAALLRIESYDIALDVTGDGEVFRSRTTITFDCTEPGASSFVDVVAETFREVRLNGTLVEPAGENRLALTGLAARNTLVVDGDFRYSNSAEGLHRFVDPVDGNVYLYSMTCIAESRRMYACFDQPDLKASFTFHVTVPDGWQVVSNAPAASDVAGTVHFEPTPPISTYIAGIAAGPYHRVTDTTGSIPLGLYCRASLAGSLDAEELFAITKEGLDFYHRAFGYPYPFAKLDQIFVPEFHADGMENAAAILYKDEFVYTSRVSEEERELRAYTILHEIAHMWFGDLVTARWWDDLWLNEAFATFMSFLARSAWTMFVQQVKSFAYVQDQLPTTHPITADIPDVGAAEVNFDGISYEKGASVLRQLLAYVGEEEFLTALSGYFRRHEFANTTLADLLDTLAKGGRDLTAWSAEWLETAGVNTLQAEYTVDSAGAFTSFAITQTAPPDHPTLRTHRLTVGLYESVDGRLTRTHRAETDISGARTEIPGLVGLRRPDLVLVNDDDLTYAKIRLDPHSLNTMLTRTGDVSESLPRTLCWTTAWDMTRLGELSAQSYVDLVLAGIGAETEFGVFAGLLANVEKTLRHYSASNGWARLADAAWSGMTTADPGSDRQLVWFHTFARAAGDRRLRGLYDGTITIPGLPLDMDARWRMLHGLIAHNAASDEDITAELARDPSSTAARLADTARALLPSPEAKAEAWAMATDDGERPGQVRMAYVAGFWHHAQIELLEPYTARYFAELDGIWTRHEGGLNAVHLSYRLFPDIVSQSTVDAADKWLARTDTPPAQHRLVLERRDEIARALENRSHDR